MVLPLSTGGRRVTSRTTGAGLSSPAPRHMRVSQRGRSGASLADHTLAWPQGMSPQQATEPPELPSPRSTPHWGSPWDRCRDTAPLRSAGPSGVTQMGVSCPAGCQTPALWGHPGLWGGARAQVPGCTPSEGALRKELSARFQKQPRLPPQVLQAVALRHHGPGCLWASSSLVGQAQSTAVPSSWLANFLFLEPDTALHPALSSPCHLGGNQKWPLLPAHCADVCSRDDK